jgi:hypothetical protein
LYFNSRGDFKITGKELIIPESDLDKANIKDESVDSTFPCIMLPFFIGEAGWRIKD